MKKVTLLLFALVMFASANAQMKEEVDLMQAAFGMEKKAMVSAFIQVDQHRKMHSGHSMMSMRQQEKSMVRQGSSFLSSMPRSGRLLQMKRQTSGLLRSSNSVPQQISLL